MIDIGERLTLIFSGAITTTFKLVVLVIAYKTIKLGYDLLIKGVKGEFKFSGELQGFKADLRSVSPGLLFVLLGCMVISIAIMTKYERVLNRGQSVEKIPITSYQEFLDQETLTIEEISPPPITEKHYYIKKLAEDK